MVFVIDTNKKPLAPCSPARARWLLKVGKAAIWRKYPFTIILKEAKETDRAQTFRLKIDYGSKHTGLAILSQSNVLWLGQLNHRTNIKNNMDTRLAHRRSRRNRKTRYRKPRFLNRIRKKGWLPPSLQSRVDNVATWVRKLQSVCPITHISYENCKFDTQIMRNAEISGVEYQQGTLRGYEVREYLLEKFRRTCCYCGVKDLPLQIEHIVPKSRGGSDRVDNLCLACEQCNLQKGNKTAAEFGFSNIQEQVKKPLKDTAIINATRWAVYGELTSTGLSVECGSGARTKMNRVRLGIAKDHCLDACCVGISTPNELNFMTKSILHITAIGRGSYSRTNLDKYGFPKSYLPRQKQFFGFQTGDMVKAVVPKGKNAGTWFGRVACRSSGNFDIKTNNERRGGISHKYFVATQKCDGYAYNISASSHP
ncbi:MAG: HNH endonuclease [Nitrososphaerota archaeon]|jgi:5-methylcytosine-specific restriction endonuclease McrA|nr:HNH endonuclease [Nitrososphaerota archaeon]